MGDDTPISFAILRSIRQIIRRISEHSRALAQRTGLTVPQLLCLKAFGERATEEGMTMAALSSAVQLSGPTVSGIVDRLVRAGLVSRRRGERDRRKVFLELTAQGEQHLEHLPMPLHEQFIRRLHRLETEEQDRLLQALGQIVEMMDASDVDASPLLATEEVDDSF